MTSELLWNCRQNIVDDYRDGTSVTELSKKYSVSTGTIYSILKELGVTRTRGRVKVDIPKMIVSYNTDKMTIAEIADMFGVNEKTIRSLLVENGIKPVSRLHKQSFDYKTAIAMYSQGIGIKGIADKFGYTRSTVSRFFKIRGITLRGRKEQQQARMDNMTQGQKNLLTQKAHIAATGRKKTPAEQSATAWSCFVKKARVISPYETELSNMLAQRGIKCISQFPIGPYNCDLAVHSVAVEVLGGHWHWYGSHRDIAEERTHFILNAGWNIIYIPVSSSDPLTDEVADYVADFIHFRRANPSLRCEYRVVWGAGEYVIRGSLDNDHFSFDPPFTARRNPTNGRYERVPRDAVGM